MRHVHNSPVRGYLNLQGLEGLVHFWFIKFPYNPIYLLCIQQ